MLKTYMLANFITSLLSNIITFDMQELGSTHLHALIHSTVKRQQNLQMNNSQNGRLDIFN